MVEFYFFFLQNFLKKKVLYIVKFINKRKLKRTKYIKTCLLEKRKKRKCLYPLNTLYFIKDKLESIL